MGKYKTLRWFMKHLKIPKDDHILKDCHLVIEGESFFRQQYKESGFNFILGGEFDRYAEYLKTTLTSFIKSNVTCYVVFTGAMKMDIKKRKETHQKIIDDRKNIVPGDKSYYYDPIFTKNVHRQVLEELGIKYCVTEYNARETLLNISRELNCPVITHNFEQCLLGMSCVSPDSIKYNSAKGHITCQIQTPELFREHIRIYDEMKPIFWTILDENLSLFDKIPKILGYMPRFPVQPLLQWIRKQGRDHERVVNSLEGLLDTEDQKKIFRESIDEITNLIFYKRELWAWRYLKGELDLCLSDDQDKQDSFKNGVITGKIPSVYINLKNNGTFSGSWVIFDENCRDAMLPVMDIVMYAHSLFWDSPKSLTFIGRLGTSVYIENIPPKNPGTPKNFSKFIEETLPGFNWSLLKAVPEDCWLVVVTLVYYISKENRDFVTAANCILLSFIILGPVSEKVGLLKEDEIKSRSLDSGDEKNGVYTYKDCLEAAKATLKYFDEGDIKETFDRRIVHELAEFQHCLQHMNYLNRLCGESIKGTNYYKTYNGTFIFNVLLQLRGYDEPMIFFESHLSNSPSVLKLFINIREVLDSLLFSTK